MIRDFFKIELGVKLPSNSLRSSEGDMERQIAVIESKMENMNMNLERQFNDHRSLRQTFTNVTFALVGLIMGVLTVVATGYYWTADKQTSLMQGQIETNANMKAITIELQKISNSIDSINKDHANYKK